MPSKRTPPVVELGADDLPAHCPNPAMPIWSMHQRVYLDLVQDSQAQCPYCGTIYRLKPGTSRPAHFGRGGEAITVARERDELHG